VKRELVGGFELDDDRARVDVAAVHRYLAEESYWARGRACSDLEALVQEAARVVGLYDGDRQIGFCRAARCAPGLFYLADVYVLEAYRGRGLGTALVREMVEAGPLAGRSWLLHTADAHDLYRRLGFGVPGERVMELRAAPR
jgi:ribosomal protein S18 acetylase RimI-like enzyme